MKLATGPEAIALVAELVGTTFFVGDEIPDVEGEETDPQVKELTQDLARALAQDRNRGRLFDPNQPRDPGGEGGGQWIKTPRPADSDPVNPELTARIKADRRKAQAEAYAKLQRANLDAAIHERRELGQTEEQIRDWLDGSSAPNFKAIPDKPLRTLDDDPVPDRLVTRAGKWRKRPASGVLLTEPDGSLWVIEPRGHWAGYQHTFPKGGLERGYTVQQNAHKELYEESGLTAELTAVLGDFESSESVTRYFVGRRTGGHPLPTEETMAVKRVTPSDAAKLLNRRRDRLILEALTGIPAPPSEPAKPKVVEVKGDDSGTDEGPGEAESGFWQKLKTRLHLDQGTERELLTLKSEYWRKQPRDPGGKGGGQWVKGAAVGKLPNGDLGDLTGDDIFPDDVGDLVDLKSAGGTTGPMFGTDATTGLEFVRKTGTGEGAASYASTSPAHLKSEMIADRLYQALGVPVPDFKEYEDPVTGNPIKVARKVEGGTLGDLEKAGSTNAVAELRAKLRAGFAVDAWLGAWDVIGAGSEAPHGNVMLGTDGTAYRLDNGGSLSFKGMGAKKPPGAWGPEVSEIDVLRESPSGKPVFGSLTDEQVAAQIHDLLEHDKVMAAVEEVPDPDVQNTLILRAKYMHKWADEVAEDADGGPPDPNDVSEAQGDVALPVGQHFYDPAGDLWKITEIDESGGFTYVGVEPPGVGSNHGKWGTVSADLAGERFADGEWTKSPPPEEIAALIATGPAAQPPASTASGKPLPPVADASHPAMSFLYGPSGKPRNFAQMSDAKLDSVMADADAVVIGSPAAESDPAYQALVAAHDERFPAPAPLPKTAAPGPEEVSVKPPWADEDVLAAEELAAANAAQPPEGSVPVGVGTYAAIHDAISQSGYPHAYAAMAGAQDYDPALGMAGAQAVPITSNARAAELLDFLDDHPDIDESGMFRAGVEKRLDEINAAEELTLEDLAQPAPHAGTETWTPQQLYDEGLLTKEELDYETKTVTLKITGNAVTALMPALLDETLGPDSPDQEAATAIDKAIVAGTVKKAGFGQTHTVELPVKHAAWLTGFAADLQQQTIGSQKTGLGYLTKDAGVAAAQHPKPQLSVPDAPDAQAIQKSADEVSAKIKATDEKPKTAAEIVADPQTHEQIKAKIDTTPTNTIAFTDLPTGTLFKTKGGQLAVLGPPSSGPNREAYLPGGTITGTNQQGVPIAVAPPHVLFPAHSIEIGDASYKINELAAAIKAKAPTPAAPAPTAAAAPKPAGKAMYGGTEPPTGWNAIAVDAEAEALFKKWMAGYQLPPAGVSALSTHKSSSATMNDYLRQSTALMPLHIAKMVAAMDAAYQEVPATQEDVIIGRKTNLQAWNDAQPGQVLQDNGFLCASTGAGVWQGTIHLKIRVPKGSKVLHGNHIGATSHESEQEVTVKRGTQFHIIDRQESSGKTILYVEML